MFMCPCIVDIVKGKDQVYQEEIFSRMQHLQGAAEIVN
jgi:hypothetical protein